MMFRVTADISCTFMPTFEEYQHGSREREQASKQGFEFVFPGMVTPPSSDIYKRIREEINKEVEKKSYRSRGGYISYSLNNVQLPLFYKKVSETEWSVYNVCDNIEYKTIICD